MHEEAYDAYIVKCQSLEWKSTSIDEKQSNLQKRSLNTTAAPGATNTVCQPGEAVHGRSSKKSVQQQLMTAASASHSLLVAMHDFDDIPQLGVADSQR